MIAEGYAAILLDLDGTLCRGSSVVPGVPEALQRLRGMGTRVGFVTNNSSRTPAQVVAHLAFVGIEAAEHEVTTSASVTADRLSTRGVELAFVIGEVGLRTALSDAGISMTSKAAREVGAVVVGFDRSVDYAALRTASIYVERGAALVASNADASFPAEDGATWPGAGAILAAIETTTGAVAEVVGKPDPSILRSASARAGGGTALVVGDRIDTDIAAAVAAGWDSVLVLTGISSREDLRASSVTPRYVVDALPDIVRAES